MLLWQLGLIVLSSLLFFAFVFVLIRYWSIRKKLSKSTVPSSANQSGDDSSSSVGDDSAQVEERESWLELLQKQKNICADLLSNIPTSDFQNKAALSCWSIFLDVEIHIIQNNLPQSDVLDLLGAFKSMLEKIDKAHEVDALFKSLKVNQSVLNELNKVIQKSEKKVSSQVHITSELHSQLDQLQSQLSEEGEIDKSLAALRAEMASMCEFFERLKIRLNEAKESGDETVYVTELEEFLEGTEETNFLQSMHSELDDKVLDLKQLAAYQKDIIADLKEQIRQVKGHLDEDGKHAGVYDISIARLEKTLLDSSHVIKRLEGKLESLQAVQYNLNIDMIKRDETLKLKEAELRDSESDGPQGMNIYGVFDEERNTMKNMEDLLHQDDFTQESDAFSSEQASKLASLRLMVNESELYVQMLENDLDKAKILREKLEYQLQHPNEAVPDLNSDSLHDKDLEEVENLKEINKELENERKRLALELKEIQSESEEFDLLQKKVDELDGKIETVQEKYVEMEDRYLTALMAKEDGA